MGLTFSQIGGTLPLSSNSVGGKVTAPIERRFHFVTPVSSRFVGVAVSYGTAGRTGVFCFNVQQSIGGTMPASSSSLTREQIAQLFELLENSIPVIHRSLRQSSAITPKEGSSFFGFYVTLKRIRERLEASNA